MPAHDRQHKAEEIFHAALRRPQDEWPAFLAEACASDDDLRREVESLLAHDMDAGEFLQAPALEIAVRHIDKLDPTFVGRLLGSYKVIRPIGSGGMGEVYLAHDTRLGRPVALKVLLRELSGDTEWKARFVQEAKAASALNHPNIITVYDVGTDQGRDFLVMEWVAGKTLDELIDGKPMPIAQTLRLATQIADALAVAHSRGIVHRDVKPSNIMVTDSGLIKVLDFGIAKSARPERDAIGTQTLPAETIQGAIFGTAAYMSPEQAEGRAVDARSDVFSFGTVLYEMLTGQRAFPGESVASVLAGVLHEQPPAISKTFPRVPVAVEHVVERCLRKEPARRFQTMHEIGTALDEVRHAQVPRAVSGDRTGPLDRVMWYALAAILLALPAAALVYFLRTVADPSITPILFTAEMGDEIWPDFSPDGKQVVFIAAHNDSVDIFVQMVDSAARLQLTRTGEWEWSPAWSPDGRWIAFIRSGTGGPQLLMVPPIGGPERKVADGLCAGIGLSWSADSRWLACSGVTGQGLSLIAAESGESRRLTSIPKDVQDLAPSFSPDGRTLLYVRCAAGTDCDLYLLSLDSRLDVVGEPRRATKEHRPIRDVSWTSDGRDAIFQSSWPPSLYRVAVFGARSPQELSFAGPGTGYPAVSRHGNVVYAREQSDVNIMMTKGDAAERHPVNSTRTDAKPAFSPDGKRLAFCSSRSGTVQVWVANADGSQPVQLTRLGEHSAWPGWSPDGRWIAFDSVENGRWDVWMVSVDGGTPRRMTNHPADDDEPSFSHDGKWIYFNSNRTGRPEVYRMPFAGGREEQITTAGGSLAQESSDGRTLYYALTNSPLSTLMEIPVGGGKGRPLDITFTARAFQVMPDGIYFIAPPDSTVAGPNWGISQWVGHAGPFGYSSQLRNGSKRSGARGYASIQFYDFATKNVRELHRLRNRLGLGRGISVSPDRKTFLYSTDEGTGWDLMLVDNFR